MNIEVLQQRLADLKFSLEDTIKGLKKEQDDSENEYAEWEEEPEDDRGDEPDVIDNDEKINAIETACDRVDEAITALDAALED